jgi:hypothetical protein
MNKIIVILLIAMFSLLLLHYCNKSNLSSPKRITFQEMSQLDLSEREYVVVHKDTLINLLEYAVRKEDIKITNDKLIVQWNQSAKEDMHNEFFYLYDKYYTEDTIFNGESSTLNDINLFLELSGDNVKCPVILLVRLLRNIN